MDVIWSRVLDKSFALYTLNNLVLNFNKPIVWGFGTMLNVADMYNVLGATDCMFSYPVNKTQNLWSHDNNADLWDNAHKCVLYWVYCFYLYIYFTFCVKIVFVGFFFFWRGYLFWGVSGFWRCMIVLYRNFIVLLTTKIYNFFFFFFFFLVFCFIFLYF